MNVWGRQISYCNATKAYFHRHKNLPTLRTVWWRCIFGRQVSNPCVLTRVSAILSEHWNRVNYGIHFNVSKILRRSHRSSCWCHVKLTTVKAAYTSDHCFLSPARCVIWCKNAAKNNILRLQPKLELVYNQWWSPSRTSSIVRRSTEMLLTSRF